MEPPPQKIKLSYLGWPKTREQRHTREPVGGPENSEGPGGCLAATVASLHKGEEQSSGFRSTEEGALSVQVCTECATLLAQLLAPSKQNSSDTRGQILSKESQEVKVCPVHKCRDSAVQLFTLLLYADLLYYLHLNWSSSYQLPKNYNSLCSVSICLVGSLLSFDSQTNKGNN